MEQAVRDAEARAQASKAQAVQAERRYWEGVRRNAAQAEEIRSETTLQKVCTRMQLHIHARKEGVAQICYSHASEYDCDRVPDADTREIHANRPHPAQVRSADEATALASQALQVAEETQTRALSNWRRAEDEKLAHAEAIANLQVVLCALA